MDSIFISEVNVSKDGSARIQLSEAWKSNVQLNSWCTSGSPVSKQKSKASFHWASPGNKPLHLRAQNWSSSEEGSSQGPRQALWRHQLLEALEKDLSKLGQPTYKPTLKSCSLLANIQRVPETTLNHMFTNTEYCFKNMKQETHINFP